MIFAIIFLFVVFLVTCHGLEIASKTPEAKRRRQIEENQIEKDYFR